VACGTVDALYLCMQLKTSRIAFAIEDKSGKRYLQPRVVVTLTVDDVTYGGGEDGTPITELRQEVEQVLESQPRAQRMPLSFVQTLGDEKLHIVPCKDCVRLLWVDRAAGVLESVVVSPGAFNEAVRGLLLWCKQTEHVWSKHVD
jgi:hypothetical protein